MNMYALTLMPGNQTIQVNDQEPLMTQLKFNGYEIKSKCGGHASCSDCIIKVLDGLGNVNDPPFEEKQFIGNVFHITHERLSCQTKVTGDVTIDISNHMELQAPVTKKATTVRRKKQDLDGIREEQRTEREERMAAKPKKLGGGKRPKAFKFNDE